MRSFVSSATLLAVAAIVLPFLTQPTVATPTRDYNNYDSNGCKKDSQFWWDSKKCCLDKGGPPQPPSPPKGHSCPPGWYWGSPKCCVPRQPPPPSSPPPQCEKKWKWNKYTWACDEEPEQPPPSTPSPKPGNGGKEDCDDDKNGGKGKGNDKDGDHDGKGNGNYNGNGRGHKRNAKKREISLCPKGTEACPIPGLTGQSGDYECLDTQAELESCGGCASTGHGQDCTAIPHAWNVACDLGSCQVFTCEPGYKVGSDGKSCHAL